MQKVVNFLIVDDVDVTRDLLRGLIQSVATAQKFTFLINILNAKNAEQARKAFKETWIDLAFLDIELPKESGLEILRFVKNEHPHCKTVMVSGNASKENVLAAVKVGILGFISKPFNQSRVEEAIINFVKQSKLQEN